MKWLKWFLDLQVPELKGASMCFVCVEEEASISQIYSVKTPQVNGWD